MRAFLVGFLALAAASACSSDSSTNPGGGGDTGGGGGMTGSDTGSGGGGGGGDTSMRQDYDDTASIVASNLNVAELAAMQASVNFAYGRLPQGFTEDVAGSMNTGTGSLTGSFGGLAATIGFECHDINHVAVPCNGAEDHVRLVLKWQGAVAGATMSADSINEKGVYYVRYVNQARPMFGGTGNTSFTATLATGVYTVSFMEASQHLLFDSTSPSLPSGGTDNFTLTIHRTREGEADRDFNVNAALVVTGTDTATLTLDGTEVYNLTLSTGVAVHQ
ncbi:MAG TPA: hypothetical protein VLT45_16015 [Kofleriaceae bacterium]|nr:hypothetical protein [Kofleriaceae bacterium]